MRKQSVLLLGLVLILSVLAGCSKPETAGEAAPPAAVNKIVTYNIGTEPYRGYDVGMGHTTGTINFFVAINGYLYRQNLQNQFAPELADGMPQVSPDGRVWTIKLKPNMKFSTGNPITAEDVKYSWTRVLDPINASEYAFILYYVKGAEAFNTADADADTAAYEAAKAALGLRVLDPLTIEVTLENPTPYFIQLLGFCTYGIVDSKFVEEVLAQGKVYGETPELTASSGPYKLTEFRSGEYFMTTKNENYVNASQVKLDGVRFTLIDQSVTELNLWETGEVDITFLAMSAADQQRLRTEGKLITMGTLGTSWYAFNCLVPPLDDVRVRQALARSLNLKTLAETVVGGGVLPADGFIPPIVPAVDDPTKPFRSNPYIDVNGGEVEEAKRLLAEAGYPGGQGFPVLRIQYGANSDQARALTEAICSMWKTNLGITIEPDGMEAVARYDARNNGDFEISMQGWGGDYADPMTFLDCMFSTNYYNYGKWTNEAYDNALRASALELDPVKRQVILAEAEKIMMDDMPVLMTYFSAKNYLQNPRIKDMVMSPLAIGDLTWAYVEE